MSESSHSSIRLNRSVTVGGVCRKYVTASWCVFFVISSPFTCDKKTIQDNNKLRPRQNYIIITTHSYQSVAAFNLATTEGWVEEDIFNVEQTNSLLTSGHSKAKTVATFCQCDVKHLKTSPKIAFSARTVAQDFMAYALERIPL